MNVIWIVADTFRQDHIGAYGSAEIRTPSLDSLADSSVRYAAKPRGTRSVIVRRHIDVYRGPKRGGSFTKTKSCIRI